MPIGRGGAASGAATRTDWWPPIAAGTWPPWTSSAVTGRTFRVDRIGEAGPTGHRFVPAERPDAARMVSEAISTSPYQFQATIRVEAPADELRRRIPSTVGSITDGDRTGALLRRLDGYRRARPPPTVCQKTRALATTEVPRSRSAMLAAATTASQPALGGEAGIFS